LGYFLRRAKIGFVFILGQSLARKNSNEKLNTLNLKRKLKKKFSNFAKRNYLQKIDDK
jgi:hypothetical protein